MHLQENDNIISTVSKQHRMCIRRLENPSDACLELSTLLRMAVGTWLTSGLLDILVMGNYFETSQIYFKIQDFCVDLRQ